MGKGHRVETSMYFGQMSSFHVFSKQNNVHVYNYTLQPLYNTVRYNAVLDIIRFKDGSQKCIDYIEK